ncbi:hypothetical protein K458DRAFT_409738 [Lentithecium fluviatile CBS 122367]|uniref:Uncharacterized protein n=1 Tax=Lentithecium fluviatile CBS 122367 TaxID=1168545 RepID=A0A6G1IGI0_9PLEO|nr:hypothetical protein K458DRAFT_409738 [Lentithecium fluviatile CBS 122367]
MDLYNYLPQERQRRQVNEGFPPTPPQIGRPNQANPSPSSCQLDAAGLIVPSSGTQPTIGHSSFGGYPDPCHVSFQPCAAPGQAVVPSEDSDVARGTYTGAVQSQDWSLSPESQPSKRHVELAFLTRVLAQQMAGIEQSDRGMWAPSSGVYLPLKPISQQSYVAALKTAMKKRDDIWDDAHGFLEQNGTCSYSDVEIENFFWDIVELIVRLYFNGPAGCFSVFDEALVNELNNDPHEYDFPGLVSRLTQLLSHSKTLCPTHGWWGSDSCEAYELRRLETWTEWKGLGRSDKRRAPVGSYRTRSMIWGILILTV